MNQTKLGWLLGILLLALIAGGSLLFYSNKLKKPISEVTSPTTPVVNEEAGLKETRRMLKDYPTFVKKTFIQQQIEGKLKAFTKNSWVIEQNGRTLTLINGSDNKVRYSRMSKSNLSAGASPSSQPVLPVEIKPEELKAGDLVSASVTYDWQTGKIMVGAITVLPAQ